MVSDFVLGDFWGLWGERVVFSVICSWRFWCLDIDEGGGILYVESVSVLLLFWIVKIVG